MTKVEDMTKAFKDMMGSFPVDMSAFDDAFKNTASMNEKLANVAVEAAEKSAEIHQSGQKTHWRKSQTFQKQKRTQPITPKQQLISHSTGRSCSRKHGSLCRSCKESTNGHS